MWLCRQVWQEQILPASLTSPYLITEQPADLQLSSLCSCQWLSPGLTSSSPEQKQEGVKGVGGDAGDSNGSSAPDCWHMIFFLILLLGLYPALTSIPHLSPGSPPSLSLPLSAVPVSVSRTFAFSRGDSLAGSPGNRAWLWPGTSAWDRLFPAPCPQCPKPPALCMLGSTHSTPGQPLTGGSIGGRLGTAVLPHPPSTMQIPGRTGWGQGGAMGSLGFLCCAPPVISCA